LELEVDEDATPTRRKDKKGGGGSGGRTRGVSPSGEATPTGSADGSRSHRADSSSRASRRRRGEEQLLFDDHLLPAEMRKTGISALPARRGHKGEEASNNLEAMKVEEDDPVVEEPEGGAELEGETDPGLDGEEEEEDQKDVTRCVCRQDGESHLVESADVRHRCHDDTV
jgi:hypothetical protein